jgi:hypothetical protein
VSKDGHDDSLWLLRGGLEATQHDTYTILSKLWGEITRK